MFLFWIALFVSIFYIAVTVYFFGAKVVAEKDLSKIGGFLAGIFTPLTFLWLICTVYSQSEDSKLTRDYLVNEMAIAGQKSLPVFSYIDYGYTTRKFNGREFKTTHFRFFNSGSSISNFKLTYENSDNWDFTANWKSGEFNRISVEGFDIKQKLPKKYDVSFTDGYGFTKKYHLVIKRDYEHIKRTDLNKVPGAIYAIQGELIPVEEGL